MREREFKSGDKVYIHCLGRWNGVKGKVRGKVYDKESGIFLHGYYVDLNFDTPEPYTEVFAEEHLELIVEPEEEEKAGEIKDSGERTEFSSGAVRDMHSGKGDMLSVPWAAMLRVSKHYENGAAKYGRYNYLKGIPVSSFIDSALRHLAKYVAGWDDEDHLAAAAFNVLGAIQMEEHNPDMCDLPWREGKRSFHYEDGKSDGGDSPKVSADVPD